MELLLHQWGDWPELYRNTDKTEATEIVIIDSQMNYRGKLDTYIALYVALFPQLVAGPIVRYSSIMNEIRTRAESWDLFSDGMLRFIYGLAKKVLIANYMAQVADNIFDYGTPESMATAWLGAIAYTLQIYFDFSGYSDMAIGLGLMFGFHFLGKLQLSLYFQKCHGILAPLAYDPGQLVQGLCVYSPGRKPGFSRAAYSESFHCLGAHWCLAWCQLDLSLLGTVLLCPPSD